MLVHCPRKRQGRFVLPYKTKPDLITKACLILWTEPYSYSLNGTIIRPELVLR